MSSDVKIKTHTHLIAKTCQAVS